MKTLLVFLISVYLAIDTLPAIAGEEGVEKLVQDSFATLESSPQDCDALDTVAAWHQSRGEFCNAINSFISASKYCDFDPDPIRHHQLGVTYIASGEAKLGFKYLLEVSDFASKKEDDGLIKFVRNEHEYWKEYTARTDYESLSTNLRSEEDGTCTKVEN